MALFSCSDGQKSYELPELKHGIFFHSILKGWAGEADQNKDGKITLDELAAFAKLETKTIASRDLQASQVPLEMNKFSGDWVLREIGRSKTTAYDPTRHRKLPAGLKHKTDTGADPSGWPMEVVSEKDGGEMVFVPAGPFQMGSDRPDEGPVHEVKLRAYYIDKFEVTNARFKNFVEQAGYRANTQWQQGADRKGITGKMDHPVVWINWDDASAFAKWAGKQLPTEAQWERAARGTGTGPFPWGDNLPLGRCNLLGPSDGFETTAPVGKFPKGASPVGCHDMAGNAAEWCRDWHAKNYPAGLAANPTGPASGKQRVIRGGCWADDDVLLYVTQRMADFPTKRADGYGFRCVWELTD